MEGRLELLPQDLDALLELIDVDLDLDLLHDLRLLNQINALLDLLDHLGIADGSGDFAARGLEILQGGFGEQIGAEFLELAAGHHRCADCCIERLLDVVLLGVHD